MKLARLLESALIEIESHERDYRHVSSRSLIGEIARTISRLDELETLQTTQKAVKALEVLLNPKS